MPRTLIIATLITLIPLASHATITRTLSLDSVGTDVQELQTLLNRAGYTVTNSGAETTYFGPATRDALTRYQIDHVHSILWGVGVLQNIGTFDPLTRAYLTRPVPQVQGASTYTFTRDLTQGDSGDDVRRLQTYLNSTGYRVADYGSETAYFGPKTKEALTRFQAVNRIYPAEGYFGQKTRAYIGAPLLALLNTPQVLTAKPTTGGGGGGTISTVTLALTVTGTGTVMVDTTPYTKGTYALVLPKTKGKDKITLTATPGTDTTFSAWGGDCATYTTQTLCSLSMSTDRTVTATFTVSNTNPQPPTSYTLTTTISGQTNSGTITKTPDQATYAPNTTVTLTATPATGYTFTSWSGCTSTTNTCTVTMSQNRTVSASFTQTTTPPPTGGAYPWYPSLNLGTVPFHNGAGDWGPQLAVQAPEAPNTTREVTVLNVAEFRAAAAVPGTRIIVGADITQDFNISTNMIDIDVVIPAGRAMGQLILGQSGATSQVINRVRIRGTTPGQYSGGTVSSIGSLVPIGDLIVDGIGIRRTSGDVGAMNMQGGGVDRLAVVNNVIHAVASGYLGQARMAVFAGNNIYTGSKNRTDGGLTGWSIRTSGRAVIVYDNRIEGTRYHRIRMHPVSEYTPQYLWIDSNTLVDKYEARMIWMAQVNGSTAYSDGVFVNNNQIYAYSAGNGCIGPSLETPHSRWTTGTNNNSYGSFTSSMVAAQNPAPEILNSTFSAWREPPAWPRAGDPRTVLPIDGVTLTSYVSGDACVAPN